jgi:protein subunit release factor B
MKELNINEKDIQEKFIRSNGPGGQHTNKTSNCVYLKHLPTGIEVKVSKERQQAINRFLARRLLVEKYERQVLKIKTPKDLKIEKARKQKKRRARRKKAKEVDVL